MGLNAIIRDVRAGWGAYRALGTVSKAHPAYELVVRDFPRELEPHIRGGTSYRIEGSYWQRNITSAPWVATFDRSVTNSATQGFYLVYLFSVDFRRLYLSLAFGTTQFEEYFTSVKERHAKLRSAATHLGGLLRPRRSLHLERLNLTAAPRDRMHFDYEQASIAAIEYRVGYVAKRCATRRRLRVHAGAVSGACGKSAPPKFAAATRGRSCSCCGTV